MEIGDDEETIKPRRNEDEKSLMDELDDLFWIIQMLQQRIKENNDLFLSKIDNLSKDDAVREFFASEMNKMNSKILFRGWLKYFKFPDEETQKKPKEFFRNPLYERDSKRKHAVGEDKIPSEKHFYAILFPDNLNIYTANNKVKINKKFIKN